MHRHAGSVGGRDWCICHWFALAALTVAGVIAGHAATYRLLLGSSRAGAAPADVGHLHQPTISTLGVVAAVLLAVSAVAGASGVMNGGRGGRRRWRTRLVTVQVLAFTAVELGERFVIPGPASAELRHLLPLALLLPFGVAVQVTVATVTTVLMQGSRDCAVGLPRRLERVVLAVIVPRPIETLPPCTPDTAWGYGARGVRGPPLVRS